MNNIQFRISTEGNVLDVGDAPRQSQLLSLSIHRSVDLAADQCHARFASDVLKASLGTSFNVDLGYNDPEPQRVFSGFVVERERMFSSTSLLADSAAFRLLELKFRQTFVETTAGAIVKALAKEAGVETDRIEDGIEISVYVVDGDVNAIEHAKRLAAMCGFEAYSTAEGKLRFARLTQEKKHAIVYGQQILAMETRQAPARADRIAVYGESPSQKADDKRFAWLTKKSPEKELGKGTQTLVVEDPALRTPSAASAVAESIGRRIAQRVKVGYLKSLGRAEIAPGDAIEIRGVPDSEQNGTYQVRAICHRYGRRSGFVTEIEFWSLGSSN